MRGVAFDLTDQKFERLLVLRRDPDQSSGQSKWICQCDCGTITSVASVNLRTGRTRSCGCLHRERTIAANAARGNAGGLTARNSPSRAAYYAWWAMIQRCTNPRADSYENYGGRGITVDPRWLNFANFLADMGERPEGLTLERKDNNGPYAPWNCVWATRLVQARNKRPSRTLKLTPDTVSKIKELRSAGMTMIAIGARLDLNRHTVSKALSLP